MTLTFGIILLGSTLCAWAVLRCMGNERDRRMIEMEARVKLDRERNDHA